MFFNTAFDVTLSIILAICAILLLTGRGDFILTKLRSKADRGKPLPYEKKKFSITMGLLCVAMLVAEIIMIFFSEVFIAAVSAMLMVAIAFVVGIVYLRKNAKVDVEEEEKKEKTLRDRINELERKSR